MIIPRPIWLNNDDVRALLPPRDAEAAVRAALRHHAQRLYIQPPKPYIRPGGRAQEYSRGRFIFMPSYLAGDFEAAGIKVIAGFPSNVSKGIPRASGIYILNSTTTGFPLALMECAELSARRTAAVAGIAVAELAGPGIHTVGILGAGPIASAVVDALVEKENVRSILIYDLNPERTAVLIGSKDTAKSLAAAESVEDCMAQSSVAVLATTGTRGYLTPAACGKKRLVVALSLDDATPELFLSANKVVVDDFRECCREEKLLHRIVQEGRFSEAEVYAELGQILVGDKIGREDADEFIYLNVMGLGLEDLAVATKVYERAVGMGIGMCLS